MGKKGVACCIRALHHDRPAQTLRHPMRLSSDVNLIATLVHLTAELPQPTAQPYRGLLVAASEAEAAPGLARVLSCRLDNGAA